MQFVIMFGAAMLVAVFVGFVAPEAISWVIVLTLIAGFLLAVSTSMNDGGR